MRLALVMRVADEGGALERWEPLAAPRGRALELHELHDAKLLHEAAIIGCRGVRGDRGPRGPRGPRGVRGDRGRNERERRAK